MSLISIGLFIVGAGLMLTGRVRFADLDAQGALVRVAGLVLMTPLMSMFILGIIIGALTRGEAQSTAAALNVLFMLEVVAWMTAVAVAYYLLYTKSGVKFDLTNFRLPDVMGTDNANPKAMNRTDAPRVMDVKQAAHYLQISEADVLDAIKAGRLAASKSPQLGYTIARSVLDEYLEEMGKPS
jgi:hypothetical protein